MSDLHRQAIVIDGLVISKWSREVFEDMHRGGITAANCTCCVWDGFVGTMHNIAQFKRWIDENDDILLQVFGAEDIERAKAENKVGIFLGWQNTSGIEDRIDNLRLFRDLGVRVIQLTYQTQNLVGSGCWESKDLGLSDYGRDVIDELNRLGILIDLSHVGPQTTRDAIEYSKRPVAYTHCCPKALRDHPRNKTDEELREITDRGGFVGFATFTPFIRGDETTVEDCITALEHVINVVGEDSVGIGTDFCQDQDAAFFRRNAKDKGVGRLVVKRENDCPPPPRGFERLSDYPNLTAAMERAGWPDQRILKVIGGNWLRFLKESWAA